MKVVLNPCVFCDAQQGKDGPMLRSFEEDKETFYLIRCKCGAMGPRLKSEQAVIEKWNRPRDAEPVISETQSCE